MRGPGHGGDGPCLLYRLLHPNLTCILQSKMKAEVKGTHTCRIQDTFQEPAPPCTQVSKGRTEVRIQGEGEEYQITGNQETTDARARMSKDWQPLFLQAVLSLDWFHVHKARKPLGLRILCFPSDSPRPHLHAQSIARGTSRLGWLGRATLRSANSGRCSSRKLWPLGELGPGQPFAFHRRVPAAAEAFLLRGFTPLG